MSEMAPNQSANPIVRNMILALAGIYIVASLVFLVLAYGRITDLEKKQAAEQQDMLKKIDDNNGKNRASIEVLAQKMGVTKQELARKTAALQRDERELATRVTAGEEATKETKEQLGAVSGAVTGVKADVGKVRDDVNATQSDLAATKAKLEHAIGDINKESELIATTHDELEVLKHRGDRNYFEFTLTKGKSPTHVATVGLQLKSVDAKKSKFTLYVMADDKTIEKKDKTVNEPLQFYTGRDHNLFEVVVNTMDKKTITGYLATPKGVNVGLLEHNN